MTSVLTSLKQIPSAGFFVPVADVRGREGPTGTATLYVNTGSDAAPVFSTNALAVSSFTSSLLSAGSGTMRDMGKTLVSSSRVFRKVQLMQPNVTGNVGGNTTDAWLSGYIELPGKGGNFTPVARLG